MIETSCVTNDPSQRCSSAFNFDSISLWSAAGKSSGIGVGVGIGRKRALGLEMASELVMRQAWGSALRWALVSDSRSL